MCQGCHGQKVFAQDILAEGASRPAISGRMMQRTRGFVGQPGHALLVVAWLVAAGDRAGDVP
jgi:hypothetical protein